MIKKENLSELETKLRTIYRNGRHEFFEDGMESEFSIALTEILKTDGPEVLEILKTYLNDDNVSFEVFSEGLVWIGHFVQDDNEHLKDASRLFLEYCLLNTISQRVKDSAGLGLALIDDPKSIPTLQMAVNREVEPKYGPSVKKNLQQVLDQLIETQANTKYFMTLQLRCKCHHNFELGLNESDGYVDAICPKCGHNGGSFKLELDPSEMVMTLSSPTPLPSHTVTYRYSGFANPVKPIDLKDFINARKDS